MPEAWLRVVEKQSLLTLHAHFLIWICGHENLQQQLENALEADIQANTQGTGGLRIRRQQHRLHAACTATSRIEAALENGYQRCFGRRRLDDEEIHQLIWKGLPKKPENGRDNIQLDRWLLNLSSIHVLVNMHDWKHRNSCFKSSSDLCRYKIPQLPVPKTNAAPIFAVRTNNFACRSTSRQLVHVV